MREDKFDTITADDRRCGEAGGTEPGVAASAMTGVLENGSGNDNGSRPSVGVGCAGPFEKMFEARFRHKDRKMNKPTLQGKLYNFLERPTGWKCFVYHFSVYVPKRTRFS